MSGIATAIAVSAVVGGGTAYMQSKAADSARKDAQASQRANDKKDALYNLMTTVGGQGASPMGDTQILPPKGNGMLGVGLGALGGALQGGMMGLQIKGAQDASAASADKKAYMDAQTAYTNNLNQASFARGADGAVTGFNARPQSISPEMAYMMTMMGAGGVGIGGTSPTPSFGGVPASSR